MLIGIMSTGLNYYEIKLFFLSRRNPEGPQTPLGAHSCSVSTEGADAGRRRRRRGGGEEEEEDVEAEEVGV